MLDYIPIPGFYDLRDFDIPAKDFKRFVRIQQFLARQEAARRKGCKVQDGVRDLSAQYQQALFSCPQKEYANAD